MGKQYDYNKSTMRWPVKLTCYFWYLQSI